jgi:RNA polymerase sigma factor (sigma-70 family)
MDITPPDQQLLQAFAAGDRIAFDSLVARHQGLVLTACRRQLPAADAEDAAQAVFLILARKPAAAGRSPSLEAWLLRTAQHVVATAHRSRARRRRAEQEAARMRPTLDVPGDEPEALPLLDRCLDELPERERAAIAMHYLAGRSPDEVARTLGCPTGTVYSHLSRGLARLRAKLARRGAQLSAGALLALLASQAQAAAIVPATVVPASASAHILATTTRSPMPHFLLPASAAILAGGIALTLPQSAPAPAAEQTPTPAVQPAPVPATQPAVTVPTALDPDTRVVLRWNDLPRSRERWAKSPFPALLTTRWGTQLPTLAAAQPGALSLLCELLKSDQSTLGIDLATGRPRAMLLARLAPGVALNLPGAQTATDGPALRAVIPLEGTRLDQLFAVRGPGMNVRPSWDWNEVPALAPAVVTTPQQPKADLEAAWQLKVETQEKPLPVSIAWTVEPFGLRETMVLSGLTPVAAQPGGVDRGVFAQLPATCLWALATGPLKTTLAAFPELKTAEFDKTLTTAGLPDAKTLIDQLGSALVWIDQGAPLPAVTLDVAMPKELGDALLALLDAKQQFSPGADGTHLGVLGFIPVQAAWKDGHLLCTTHSGGIAAASAKAGGFATQPEVASALKELPTGDLLLAGISRSSESWGSVTRLAGWLIQRKPELASLAGDLGKAGKYGFLALRRNGPEVRYDAGGLFGGPVGTSVITGQFLQLMLNSAQPRPQPAPSPLPGPGAEKPKPVEF